ncbi:MAG: hemin uptake protein HemP [Gammaproteobacteria bacterium]|nr:hemin uptake protein HemP [Gammaproteobacteria bacterium]MBU1603253.1 hemin uptake protein HemP [Gammaproteobacteria bacterium]MBU2432773.1 hemin uptake protein HemP [Gammaproteobacteria bacterium]MBU2450016.1 hemin uptake protein HemP [Gammaproteobacteria bacterium]
MNPQPPTPEPTPPAEKTESRPRIDSQKILAGATTVEIEHAGQRYLLRVTRENKLILTK